MRKNCFSKDRCAGAPKISRFLHTDEDDTNKGRNRNAIAVVVLIDTSIQSD